MYMMLPIHDCIVYSFFFVKKNNGSNGFFLYVVSKKQVTMENQCFNTHFVDIMTGVPHELQNYILRFVPNHFQSMKQGLLKQIIKEKRQTFFFNITLTGESDIRLGIGEFHPARWICPNGKEGWLAPNRKKNRQGELYIESCYQQSKEIGRLDGYICIGSEQMLQSSMESLNLYLGERWIEIREEDEEDFPGLSWEEYVTIRFECPWYNKTYYVSPVGKILTCFLGEPVTVSD